MHSSGIGFSETLDHLRNDFRLPQKLLYEFSIKNCIKKLDFVSDIFGVLFEYFVRYILGDSFVNVIKCQEK